MTDFSGEAAKTAKPQHSRAQQAKKDFNTRQKMIAPIPMVKPMCSEMRRAL